MRASEFRKRYVHGPMLEKDWQAHIVKLAKQQGWLVYHTYDSRRSNEGFPDLVMVRERVVWVECKREGEEPTRDQQIWLGRLWQAGQEAYVWRPSDEDEVARVLSR